MHGATSGIYTGDHAVGNPCGLISNIKFPFPCRNES